MVCDYHAHMHWDPHTRSYDTAELLADMDRYAIGRRLVSALFGPGIREQNDQAAALALAHPERIDACAVLNPKLPDCVAEAERIAATRRFKAIELDSLEHNYFPEEQKTTLDTVFEIAAAAGLAVNAFTGWGCRTMPAQWAFYAQRHPRCRLVLLHMGTTDFGYGLIDLAPQYDNLYVETSCLYELPILRKAFAAIRPERILFGSHFPHKFTACSLHTFDLLDLPQTTRDKMFCQNYRSLLSIEGDA